MRIHIQGVFLLLVLVLVFWYVINLSTETISDALEGSNRAIVAVPETGETYELLNNEEVAILQQKLLDKGYDPGTVDGILGIKTRNAIDAAKTVLNLQGQPDRVLYLVLTDDLDNGYGQGSSDFVEDVVDAEAPSH